MAIEFELDEVGNLRRLRARDEDLVLERLGDDYWFLRVGDARGENVVVHLQTIAGAPDIRATFAKQTPRRRRV
jgi:hypothetical protein